MSDIVERLRTVTLPLITHAELREAAAEIERLRAALQEIEQWSRAYPLANFPKPDLQRAHKLLQAGGIMLDAVSADAMRHVVEGVGDIATLLRENERMRAALQALHDWNVEYARINNLFNGDGTPATFHELLEARRALEPKP